MYVLRNPKRLKYKYKIAGGDAIHQLALSFSTNEDEIQTKKLHGLRNQHSGEMKKEKTTKKGKGADELYKSKWIHFESLKFLSTEGNIGRNTISNLSNEVSIVKSLDIIMVIFFLFIALQLYLLLIIKKYIET